MTVEEDTVVAAAEEAIVTAEAEEAIEDKDKSSHRLIGSSNNDEGSGRVSSGGSDKIPTTAPVTAPARFRRLLRRRLQRLLRRGSGSFGETVGRRLENSSE